MSWKRAGFKGQRVWARVGDDGALLVRDGRVDVRYSDKEGATIYQAGASRVAVEDGAARSLPDGTAADATPKEKKPGAPASRGSGFGKAGTRTKTQAAAAAAHANQRIDQLPDGTVLCFTDGACKGNPGPAGSGVLLRLPDGRHAEASRSLGRATNNVAELTAIEMALDLLEQAGVDGSTPTAIFTDSSYAEGVLAKGWKAKANTELVTRVKARLKARTGARLHWVAGHVGIDGNERADVLANRGVDGVTATTPLSAAD